MRLCSPSHASAPPDPVLRAGPPRSRGPQPEVNLVVDRRLVQKKFRWKLQQFLFLCRSYYILPTASLGSARQGVEEKNEAAEQRLPNYVGATCLCRFGIFPSEKARDVVESLTLHLVASVSRTDPLPLAAPGSTRSLSPNNFARPIKCLSSKHPKSPLLLRTSTRKSLRPAQRRRLRSRPSLNPIGAILSTSPRPSYLFTMAQEEVG